MRGWTHTPNVLASALLLCSGCATVEAGRMGEDGKPADTKHGDGPGNQAPDAKEADAKDAEAVSEEPEYPPVEHRTVLIRGATVMTVAGKTFAPGAIRLKAGRIEAVGEMGDAALQPQEGEEVVEAGGMFVTPGIVDTHSHLGVYATPHVWATSDGNEISGWNTSHVESRHGFWPQDPGLQTAVAGGATTLQILPGSANLIGGRAVTVKLRPERGVELMRFPKAPMGLKMACGENPKRVYGKHRKGAPNSRMGNIAMQRQAYLDAQAYQRRWDKYRRKLAEYEEKKEKFEEKQRNAERRGEKPDPEAKAPEAPDLPDTKLGPETLSAAMRGEILVHIHCYRADEMLTMMQLADEMGFKVRSFHHAVEAYKIGDELARHGAATSTWADWWGFKLEAYDGIPENAALVHARGAMSIIHSDSAIGVQRLNQEAAKAYHAGRRAGLPVSEEDALAWITKNPAWALGIEEQTGTLEKGKMADVVLWDKHPLSVYARPQRVFIDGQTVLDRNNLQKDPWSDFLLGQDPIELGPFDRSRRTAPPKGGK